MTSTRIPMTPPNSESTIKANSPPTPRPLYQFPLSNSSRNNTRTPSVENYRHQHALPDPSSDSTLKAFSAVSPDSTDLCRKSFLRLFANASLNFLTPQSLKVIQTKLASIKPCA